MLGVYGTPKRRATFSAPPAKRRRYMPMRRTRKTYSRYYTRTYTKRVPVRTKTAARINKSRIAKLEDKVNGHVQKGYHKLAVRYNPVPGGFVWGPAQPLLFALNDFYTQTTAPAGGTGAAYHPQYAGVAPNITMQAGIMNRWQDYVPGNTLGYAAQYQQWKDVAYSQPSKVGYLPLGTDIRVVVNRSRCTPTGGDWWIRIDCFKAKRSFLPTSGGVDPKNYNMPNALGALANLAVAANVRENEMNPALWTHTTKTRWIKLPAPDIASQNINKVFHIKCAFPKKFLRCNLDVDAGGNSEQFWQMMDPKTIHWCMLSLSKDSPGADDPIPDLYITRQTTWRDSRGVAM